MSTVTTNRQSPRSLTKATTSWLNSWPLVTIGVFVLAVVLAFSPTMSQALQFDRAAVADGQLWRAFTGHLTHWNLDHFFWDAVVFAVLGVLCEWRHRGRYLVCLFVSAILIPLFVSICLPELTTYRGLSGLDTALFTMLACYTLAERWAAKEWGWVLTTASLLLGLSLKVVFEVVTGATLFVDAAAANFQPIPLAHIVGACVGCIVAVWPREGCLENSETRKGIGTLRIANQVRLSVQLDAIQIETTS